MNERSDIFVIELPKPHAGRKGRATSNATTALSRFPGMRIRTMKGLRERFLEHRGQRRASLFVSYDASDFSQLADIATTEKGNLRLLVFDKLSEPRREFLQTLFRSVFAPTNETCFLPQNQLAQALAASNREDLFVGGTINRPDQVVVLFRGNFERLVVPFRWFEDGTASKPNYALFELDDFGSTVRFGSFEAAADAILYDFDPVFRAAAKKRELQHDGSFGASVKRLRLSRGLSRSDFAPVSAREIARIERGEVRRPHRQTSEIIARKLAVAPGELGTF